MGVSAGEYFAAAVLCVGGLLGFRWLSGVTRLLPDRPTDVLYLRSFRTDIDTADIRTSLERAFGDGIRVSGIREPRRRWPAVLRFMSYLVFTFRYAHPRYMNLEAGSEWKGRLWRSLGEARGVVIDVADLTPAVAAEVRLCMRCVGLRRILFVGRDTAPTWEWRARITDQLDGTGLTEDVHIAKWTSDAEGRSRFEKEVLEFANQLPSAPAGFAAEARQLAEQLPDQRFRESNRHLVIEIAVGLILGTAITAAVNLLWEAGGVGSAMAKVLFFVWCVVVSRQYAEFRRHCGSARRLRLARATILPVQVLAGVVALAVTINLLLPDVRKVREAADRMKCSNNLKQIGLAMNGYHDACQQLPTANAASSQPWSPHPVSWRVQLLPYIDADDLYQRYRFDEPWDGPNNRQLITDMPRIYRCPTDPESMPVGHTYFRVFASPPGVKPSAAFIDGQPGRTLLDLTDGTPNTLLVVEAAEAVPWTQPECLPFTPSRMLPKLGGHFRGGYHGLMADGSVRFFRSDRPEAWIRADVTANGGEPAQE